MQSSKNRKPLEDNSLKRVFSHLLSAVNMVCKEYSLKTPYEDFKLVRPSKRLFDTALKVVDDLEPFFL